ncbi:MAG TPA: hypothetical protein VE982_07655 [Gaiellaceae bacterium]|nr:hypothetical protein [Gaiellaceae bacterium]
MTPFDCRHGLRRRSPAAGQCSNGGIHATAGAPERVGELGALAAIARDIRYDNFKNEVAARDRRRAHLYHDVWAALGRLQEGGPYS